LSAAKCIERYYDSASVRFAATSSGPPMTALAGSENERPVWRATKRSFDADCRQPWLIDAEGMLAGARYVGFQLARARELSQLVKDVRDVPTAVNYSDDFDHAGTFAVEDEIVPMGEQPQLKSSVTEYLAQLWLIREQLD
jgi:hypothetical protein